MEQEYTTAALWWLLAIIMIIIAIIINIVLDERSLPALHDTKYGFMHNA